MLMKIGWICWQPDLPRGKLPSLSNPRDMEQTSKPQPSSATANACEIVRTIAAGEPQEIGGYQVCDTLTEGQSWVAVAPAERRVVLKTLDDDCLWKGQLHPSIKDRLGRVRELAHTGVANLYGVERDGNLVYLVWEFVAGQTLEDYAASAGCGQRDFCKMAREMVLSLETLHARGIVHGAIKSSNVIVVDGGRSAVLTHVSPWLYTEPRGDVDDLLELLDNLLDMRGEGAGTLGRLLAEAREKGFTLRQISARLGGLIESREPAESLVVEEGEKKLAKRIQRRSLAGAVGMALVGLGIFAGVWFWSGGRTAKAATPAVAPSSAFEPAIRSSARAVRSPAPTVLPTPMPVKSPVSMR